MGEGHVKKACIQLLCLWGCDTISNVSGAVKTEKGHFIRFGKKDSGDVIAVSPYGRWIEVECKFGKNDLSDGQIRRQQLVNAMGGVYIICRDSTDELEKHKDRILAKPNWSHP